MIAPHYLFFCTGSGLQERSRPRLRVAGSAEGGWADVGADQGIYLEVFEGEFGGEFPVGRAGADLVDDFLYVDVGVGD